MSDNQIGQTVPPPTEDGELQHCVEKLLEESNRLERLVIPLHDRVSLMPKRQKLSESLQETLAHIDAALSVLDGGPTRLVHVKRIRLSDEQQLESEEHKSQVLDDEVDDLKFAASSLSLERLSVEFGDVPTTAFEESETTTGSGASSARSVTEFVVCEASGSMTVGKVVSTEDDELVAFPKADKDAHSASKSLEASHFADDAHHEVNIASADGVNSSGANSAWVVLNAIEEKPDIDSSVDSLVSVDQLEERIGSENAVDKEASTCNIFVDDAKKEIMGIVKEEENLNGHVIDDKKEDEDYGGKEESKEDDEEEADEEDEEEEEKVEDGNQDEEEEEDQEEEDDDEDEEEEDELSLYQEYGAAEDLNSAGLRRAKKSPLGWQLPGTKKGGKSKAPAFVMEDAHFIRDPVDGVEETLAICVLDGHVGPGCAMEAKEIMPDLISSHLKSAGVDQRRDLSESLISIFNQTDAMLRHHEYEGSTCTLALVWRCGGSRYVQTANVGDSTAFLFDGTQTIQLSVDHKVTNPLEKERIRSEGIEITEHQTRISGLAVSRALGDFFTKNERLGVVGTPQISQPVLLKSNRSILIVASDGLWDVMTGEEAVGHCLPLESAETMASELIRIAIASRKCNDNITVIVCVL